MSHIFSKEDTNLKVEEIRKIAGKLDIKTANMKKTELIRAIQEAEGNSMCFDTGKAAECGQVSCLWVDDCK